MFGGNSNWRGPVWFPVNYLLIESLQKFHHYFGDDVKVDFPTGSGQPLDLWNVAAEISTPLEPVISVRGQRTTAGLRGKREVSKPIHTGGTTSRSTSIFNGDTGEGLGASHQTGWTGLVAKLLEQSGV